MLSEIAVVLFLLIVASLIWGRLFFFKVNSGTPRMAATFYDLAVATQMLVTIYYFYSGYPLTPSALWLCVSMYSMSLIVFWLSVRQAKSLDFAFSNHVGEIVTTGTFSIFRHPFYVSYLVAWAASTIAFNNIYHWLTFIYLIFFYVLSARKEEGLILRSPQGNRYKKYQQSVGMFVPRMGIWKI